MGNNSYGNVWFKSNGNEIATWKFKINSFEIYYFTEQHEIYFTFCSKDNRINEETNQQDDTPNYGWSNNKETVFSGKGQKHFGDQDDSIHRKGDIFSITLNTKNGIIEWSRCDDKKETVYSGIERDDNIKYKLALSLRSKNNSVTLIDFNCLNA